MKRTPIFILLLTTLILSSCATAKFNDGNKTVEYTTIMRTADRIEANIQTGEVIIEKQKIDTTTIDAIIEVLKTMR